MHPEMTYKLCKFCKNRARDMPLWPFIYSEIWRTFSKIFSLGVRCPYRCTDGSKIWHGGVDLPPLATSPCQISPHWCNMSPLWGEKPQNNPL